MAKFKDNSPVEGFVRIFLRDKDTRKVVDYREGHNVFTLTGREHLAQLMSYSFTGPTPATIRNDRIFYIGVGIGANVEVASVTSLASPTAYTTGSFLKAIQSTEFPTVPATSVIYKVEFGANEISIGGGNVILTEAGLFTDGDEFSHIPGNRLTAIGDALDQKPSAYKNYEPFTKTTSFTLEIQWEIRFR